MGARGVAEAVLRSPEHTVEARQRLEALGLSVVQEGPTSLSITFDKDLFEQTFETTLQERRQPLMPSKGVAAEGHPYYEATKPIRVPGELSPFVADIVLPRPPEFFH